MRRRTVVALGRRVPRETLIVLAVAGALLAVGVVSGDTLVGRHPFLQALALPWWVIAVAFAVTEAVVLHIQDKREAQSVSLSELPLVLGLFLASPVDLLVGRLVGSALVFVVRRRATPLKSGFNVVLVACESCVAIRVFDLVAAWAHGAVPGTWLAAYAAAGVANAVTAVGIGLVIAGYEGGLRPRRLLWDAVAGQPAMPIVVTIALVAVTSLAASTRSAWLLLGAAAGLIAAYRAYASLSDRHLSLERMYQFSQAVTSSPEADEVLRSVLSEAKALLRCEQAEVAFVASGDRGVARVRLGPSGRLSRSEGPQQALDGWLLSSVLDAGAPVLMPRGSRDQPGRGWLDSEALREAVAVPLRGGAGIIGALLVADRLGDVRTFDAGDVLLLETVANHASIALQNGELIARLRHDALHDGLTGLPNRVNLQRDLAAALADVAEGRVAGAGVMILDLDRFKDVNDTLGHQQGDLLLVEVAARLRSAVRGSGTVARLGGDEFAVLVPGTAEEEPVLRVARRVLTALEQPVDLDGLEVEIGGSLGVALAPAHATDAAALL